MERRRGGARALTPKAEKGEDETPGTRSHSGLRKVKSSPFLAWLKRPECSSGRSDAVRSLATSRLSSTASGTAAPPPWLLPPPVLPPPPVDPEREDISPPDRPPPPLQPPPRRRIRCAGERARRAVPVPLTPLLVRCLFWGGEEREGEEGGGARKRKRGEGRVVGWVTWEGKRIWRSTGRGNPARHALCTISAKVGRPTGRAEQQEEEEEGPLLRFFFERLRVQSTKATVMIHAYARVRIGFTA